MTRILFGVFIILHGLVHLWYLTLSQGWVAFKPDMPSVGWTGKSWLFTSMLGEGTTLSLAGVLYLIATIAFVISGIGFFINADWWRIALIGAAAISSMTILLYWDGNMQMLVEKGAIGLLISAGILFALLGAGRSFAF